MLLNLVNDNRTLGFIMSLLMVLTPVALKAEEKIHNIQNIFEPLSTPAESILDIAWVVLAICAAIFVVVAGLIAYAIFRFRSKKSDEGSEPAQVYGSNQIELAWTVIPLLIVLVLIFVTARKTIEIQDAPIPPGALEINVIGHQWWWEVEYPQYGFLTANEIHIPVSEEGTNRPTIINLESADVIHSFWVPKLGGKRDLVPNYPNQIWYEPSETGIYLGNCAEFCGTQHANMQIRVIVQTHEDFKAWLENQQTAPREVPEVETGRNMFESLACISCHAVGEKGANNGFGPDLTHLMSRQTIGAGVALTNYDDIYQWLKDPDSLKPGCYMPNMKLTDNQLKHITNYLLTLE